MENEPLTALRFGILTVSDRSARGERMDSTGPALAGAIEERGWEVARSAIVADEKELIEQNLLAWCDSQALDIILTTGGTGFSPRDVTPEATQAVVDRNAPGLSEAMRSASLRKTPHAMLSRAICGMRGATLIVNLPGSPRAALENLDVIAPVLPHAVELLRADPHAEKGHQAQDRSSL